MPLLVEMGQIIAYDCRVLLSPCETFDRDTESTSKINVFWPNFPLATSYEASRFAEPINIVLANQMGKSIFVVSKMRE